MRLSRALAVLVPVVLLAPVAGVVTPASAATPTTISIAGKPDTAIYHDDIGPKTADVVRHRGQLAAVGGEPIDGATVVLARQMPGGEWTELDEDVTNADGRYEFLTYVAGNAEYRVTYTGDAEYTGSKSGVHRLKAMRDFNAVLVEKPKSAVLKGNINPGWDNKVVTWQRKTCKACGWKKVDQAKSGDNGAWAFTASYPPLGKKWRYRATIDGDQDFVKSFSAMLVTTTTAGRVAGR